MRYSRAIEARARDWTNCCSIVGSCECDDDDAVGYSIQEWGDGGIETGFPVVDEPFNFGIRVGFEEYS